MVFGVNSTINAGDPQSPDYKEPEFKKKLNPGFAHWFNKQMNRLQTEYMELNNDDFMKWAEKQWKS